MNESNHLSPEDREILAELHQEHTQSVMQRWRRVTPLALALLVIALVGYGIWYLANNLSAVKRETQNMTAIIPLPPPPPPPPEPEQTEPQNEPEPELAELPEPEPEPVAAPEPEPEQAPIPQDATTEAMQMDTTGQAGSDVFNIAAGKGHGMAGAGGLARIGNATYGQYLGYALQKVLREAETTRQLVYRIRLNLWIDHEGRVVRASITRSSGDPDIDKKVLLVLRQTTFEQRPTRTIAMPVEVALTSRRPS